eukprot:1117344-Rhodomonas_salina.1
MPPMKTLPLSVTAPPPAAQETAREWSSETRAKRGRGKERREGGREGVEGERKRGRKRGREWKEWREGGREEGQACRRT